MNYKTSKEIQERKDSKRQLIIDTATKVFAARGYHHTSVKDIVDEAKISIGSFYSYFKSKEELFASLYDELAQKHIQITQKVLAQEGLGLAKSFTRAVTASLWTYQNYRDLARIMLIDAININAEFEKRWYENIKQGWVRMGELFKELQDKGLIDIPDLRVTAMAFESSYYYLIIDWLEGDGSTKLTDAAYSLVVYNLQALKADFDKITVKNEIEKILKELDKKIYE